MLESYHFRNCFIIFMGNNLRNSKFSWIILTERYPTEMNWIKYGIYWNRKEIANNLNLKDSNSIILSAAVSNLESSGTALGWGASTVSNRWTMFATTVLCLQRVQHAHIICAWTTATIPWKCRNGFWHKGWRIDNISHPTCEIRYCLGCLVIFVSANVCRQPFPTESLGWCFKSLTLVYKHWSYKLFFCYYIAQLHLHSIHHISCSHFQKYFEALCQTYSKHGYSEMYLSVCYFWSRPTDNFEPVCKSCYRKNCLL